jgi:hypothetical protein
MSSSTGDAVPCPVCGRWGRRVHSRSYRKPWDLPGGRSPVQLIVRVRQFFCGERCRADALLLWGETVQSQHCFANEVPGGLPGQLDMGWERA